MEEFDISKFEPEKNMYIKASAGTGKTYTVQQIVAELLRLNSGKTLENILIVTYTEKAAGELRDRIRSKIQEVIKDRDYNTSGDSRYLSVEEQEKKFIEQLALVDNAPIYTIHSFCKQTLDEFGFCAKQCDELELVDDAQIKSFIDEWLRDKLISDSDAIKFLILKESRKIDVNLFVKGYKKYYQDLDEMENQDIVILDYTLSSDEEKEIARFSEQDLRNLQSKKTLNDVNFLLNFADKIDDKDISTDVDEKRSVDENANLAKNLNDILTISGNNIAVLENEIKALIAANKTGTVGRQEKIDYYNKLILQIKDAQRLNNVYKLPKKLYSKIKNDIGVFYDDYLIDLDIKLKSVKNWKSSFQDILEIKLFETQMPQIYAGWNRFKAANKMQSFDDMIRNVHEAVCNDDCELRKKLQEKYSYAIIDEFQDTNQKQWNIFSHIFMEDKNHSICVVGDPKQSIYAFQGADVNVYTNAIQQIENGNFRTEKGKAYYLGRNYRSTNLMIDFCNALFRKNQYSDFFGGNSFTFEESAYPAKAVDQKPNATFKGSVTEPVWILEKPQNQDDWQVPNETDFAYFVADQIIQCCSYENGKTNLQVYKKSTKDNGGYHLTDVDFSDFAVLCKSSSEMDAVKDVFNAVGIPYNHYKESNLFSGIECRDWIALYNAIAADDFSASNRKILNECLISDFFKVSLKNVKNEIYDKPDCKERRLLVEWKKLAENRQWAYLQEQIFEETKVEERLSQLDKLTSLCKLRQIGDYCVNYLYKNNCSIEDLINHLTLLASEKSDSDEEDGNIVAKGTDFKTVQIMTIHASKGLEFPVVIAPAGLKDIVYDKDIYSYHLMNKYHITSNKNYDILGNGYTAEGLSKQESYCQWMRLFYVAYTRATSLMILPWTVKDGFEFLNTAFKKSDAFDMQYLKTFSLNNLTKFSVLQNAVKEIIGNARQSKTDESDSEMTQQLNALKDLSKKIPSMSTYKLSYSNLSHGKKDEEYVKGHASDQDNVEKNEKEDLSKFDLNRKLIEVSYYPDDLNQMIEGYPKGNLLGEAVHQVLENAEFERIGTQFNQDSVQDDKALGYLIDSRFRGQGIKIDSEDSKGIRKQTAKMVWNTLNAQIPEIIGNHATGKNFSLKSLKDNEHKAELEFNMNPDISQNKEMLKDYFNGFIDLIFYRNVDGKNIYSIADWKTDSMEEVCYADEKVLCESTDSKYSIQRVLYSYCLIKWLRQFNLGADGKPAKTEAEIFNEQFGGIYYIYVRGCKAGSGNGIYAQTWENWETLEQAFYKIIDEKIPGKA